MIGRTKLTPIYSHEKPISAKEIELVKRSWIGINRRVIKTVTQFFAIESRAPSQTLDRLKKFEKVTVLIENMVRWLYEIQKFYWAQKELMVQKINEMQSRDYQYSSIDIQVV